MLRARGAGSAGPARAEPPAPPHAGGAAGQAGHVRDDHSAALTKAAPTRELLTQRASDSDFHRFVEAINRTAVSQLSRSGGSCTVFAPTDSSRGSILATIRDDVLSPNAPTAPVRGRALVISHLQEGRHVAGELAARRTVGRHGLTCLAGRQDMPAAFVSFGRIDRPSQSVAAAVARVSDIDERRMAKGSVGG